VIYEISSTDKNKKFVVTNTKQKRRQTGADASAMGWGYIGYMVNPTA
jgi:hypothetical protein